MTRWEVIILSTVMSRHSLVYSSMMFKMLKAREQEAVAPYRPQRGSPGDT
jgi:hypothetical protein